MNIIVRPFGSDRFYCRPDTTWERENKDFYSPECVDTLYWTPVIFARISKAGKCIGRKFASRYYDAVGFGALLYIGNADDPAFSSCADHTSILPSPLYDTAVLEGEDNMFELMKDGISLGRFSSMAKESIEDALCNASLLTSLRIGDFVAVEMAQAGLLASRQEGSTEFKATFCGNDLFDFRIVF